jgi:hypothetical protein
VVLITAFGQLYSNPTTAKLCPATDLLFYPQ